MATVSTQEKNALIDFYNQNDGANWDNNTNWLEDDPCDNNWAGISCEDSKIIGFQYINYSSSNTAGSIPESIGDLVHLKELELEAFDLSGSIPESFYTLTALEKLRIQNTQLSGTISSSITDLSALKELIIYNSYGLSGLDSNKITALTQLEILRVSEEFSGTLSAAFNQLTNLTSLEIDSHNLQGTIPSEIGSMIGLTWLYLSGDLTGNFPNEIGNLTNLTGLAIHGNGITGSIPSDMADLINLRLLGISGAQVSGNISFISGMNKLRTLYIIGSNITGSLPSELGQMSDLEMLLLRNNQLDGPIPEFTEVFHQLTWMDLSHNRLSGQIPASISNLAGLSQLDLNSNQLTGQVPPSIVYWGNNIYFINLEFNALDSDNQKVNDYINDNWGPAWGSSSTDWREPQTLPPAGLSTTNSSHTTVTLNWEETLFDWEDGSYEIQKSSAIDGPYDTVFKSHSKHEITTTISDLVPNQTYYFRARSITEPFVSEWFEGGMNKNQVQSEYTAPISLTTPTAASTTADLYVQSSYDSRDYNIVVGNNSNTAAEGRLINILPMSYNDLDWECTNTTNGAICPAADGQGDIDFVLTLPANSQMKFIFDKRNHNTPRAIVATISPTNGLHDPELENNTSVIYMYDTLFQSGFENN